MHKLFSIFDDVPIIEKIYWLVAVAETVAIWLNMGYLSEDVLLLLFAILIILYLIWYSSVVNKSSYFNILIKIDNVPNRVYSTFLDIKLIFETINKGELTVSSKTLVYLKSVRRALYYGLIPVLLYIVNRIFSIAIGAFKQ